MSASWTAAIRFRGKSQRAFTWIMILQPAPTATTLNPNVKH
jgi:hypothetical protein